MGPKKNSSQSNKSPAAQKAKGIVKKYAKGYRASPSRPSRVKKALFQVKEKNVSIRNAAQENNLSYGFLHRRLTGAVSPSSRNGPKPFLPKEEEEMLAKYISEMAIRGMGFYPGEILDLVQSFLKKEKRPNPFKDDRPGYRWLHDMVISWRKERKPLLKHVGQR